MSADLLSRVRDVIDMAEQLLPSERSADVQRIRIRLDGPLRVAIAGRVKAGKSTLLNALVGVRLAPTDAGECTKVVSWYRHGRAPAISIVPHRGPSQMLGSWQRDDGELEISLDGWQLDDVHHLDIAWPTGQLKELVLIDTPGLASASAGVSDRTTSFMLGENDEAGEADAVIYLLRNAHPTDLSFLEAFRGSQSDSGVAINSIGVVSRADEVGGGGLHAMRIARSTAERFTALPDLQRRCQVVIPIAGLLAQGAMQYSENDHQALRAVARESAKSRRRLLLSATRFCNDPEFVVPPIVRRRVLGQLGLFGVRLAVELLAERDRPSHEIAASLREASGLAELERLLKSQFAARAQVLKCRSALYLVQSVAKQSNSPAAIQILDRVRDIEIETHEFEELGALQRLRSGEVDPTMVDLAAAERLLGGFGVEPRIRLDLAEGTGVDEMRRQAYVEVAIWRKQAEHPLLGRAEREVCGAVRRSAEGIAAAVTPRA